MGQGKYADWLDEVLERGIYLSELKKLVKGKFPEFDMDYFWTFIGRRRKRGWKIEKRYEGNDVFYKIVEKPEKRQGKEKDGGDSRVAVQEPESVSKGIEKEGSEVGEGSGELSKQKVVYGAGVYTLREMEDGKFKLSVKVGMESKTVEFSDGDVEEVIGELFGGVAEVKSVSREKGGVERGVFILYKIV